MTRVCNDPTRFADEAIDGFVATHPHTARRVQGGVVRAAERGGGVLLACAQQLQEVAR